MTTWLLFHWMVLTAMATLPISKEAEYIRVPKGASRAVELLHHLRLFHRALLHQTGSRSDDAAAHDCSRASSRRHPVRSDRRPERPKQKNLDRRRPGSRHLGPR